MSTPAPPYPTSSGRPALRRSSDERWLGGVAAGMAAHLRVPVVAVRVALVGAMLLGGAGGVLYVFWWVTVPAGTAGTAGEERPAAWTRLVRPASGEEPEARSWSPGVPVAAAGLALLVAAGLGVAWRVGAPIDGWVVPALLMACGTIVAWSQLDDRGGGARDVRSVALPLAGGLAIAGTGVFLLVGQSTPPAVLAQAGLAVLAVTAGVALVLAPWGLRLLNELAGERAARARESERADIAAHLHDSVLQTLALIRSRSTEPEVQRLARSQERDLRRWLYDDRVPAGSSVAAQVRLLVAEVEDASVTPDGASVEVETVVVGDAEPDDGTHAVLAATREALLNAVAHARPPVSLYVEATTDALEVFVRDHGDGFELADVPADRFGVRESILGRVRRRGGQAEVNAVPSGGTEVRLWMPKEGREG